MCFEMSKVEDFLNAVKLGEIMHTKKEEEKRANKWLAVLAIIGIIVIVGIVAYTVYKVLTPEEMDEEYDDEYEDGFNDFEDEDDELCLRKVPKPLRVVNDSDYDSDYDSDDED